MLFREYGDTWNPTPGNKLYEREQQLCKKMAEVSPKVLAYLEAQIVVSGLWKLRQAEHQ